MTVPADMSATPDAADAVMTRRASRYDPLRGLASLTEDHGVLLVHRLDVRLLLALQQTVLRLLGDALNLHGSGAYDLDAGGMTEAWPAIRKLPNVTPGGIVHPRKELASLFDQLHRATADVFAATGLDEKIGWAWPTSLRVVGGSDSSEIEGRPYATAKLHSDAWSANIGDGNLVIPVLGDFDQTSIGFYKPTGIDERFFGELANYDDGRALYKEAVFLSRAGSGYLYLFDHACLHRTERSGSSPRITLSFLVAMNTGSETPETLRSRHFLPMAEWMTLGRNLHVVPRLSMRDDFQSLPADPYRAGPVTYEGRLVEDS